MIIESKLFMPLFILKLIKGELGDPVCEDQVGNYFNTYISFGF